jgi:lysyl-tRNA synthetase class 2
MDPKDHIVQDGQIESNEHEIRLAKLQKMQEDGLKPWPAYKPVSHTSAQAIQAFQQDPNTTEKFSLAGRLLIKRDHGKSFFGVIQDRDGRIQIYIKKDEIGETAFEQCKKYIDIGDIIWVSGPIFITKTGERTIKVESLSLLSKCLHPLPEKFHGLTDIEQKYRQRYLDLISNPESADKFKKRSQIVQSIRSFLQERDFLEVETPMLHPIPGGAAARPFVTHHNAYDMQLFLRIAPELYLKKLVIGGFERVFEINRCFRNEGISTRHNPEFTTVEFYMAHGDYRKGIELTEQLLQAAVLKTHGKLQIEFQGKTIDFSAPFKRLTVEESLIEIGKLTAEQISPANIDKLIKEHNIEIHKTAGHGAKLFALFEALVEANIVQPTFIVGYPVEVSPLAKRDEQNPTLAARFELFICGMEYANGFTELNDPLDQAERFKAQVMARESGDQEAHHYDADFVKALEFGLPPTVGVGIGVDRLAMMLTNTSSIKDIILFPTLKNVKE